MNRPLGRRVAAAAHTVGMTPNQATAASATLSGLALLLLATTRPGWLTAALVPTLLAAGYVMDSVDGQLARLRGGGSRSGEWLDHTVDCFKTCLFHLAVLVSWYRFPPVASHLALLVPVAFEVVDMVAFFGLVTMPLLRTTASTAPTAPPAAPEHPFRTWLILPTDYGVFCWVFALMAWPTAFFAGYTGLLLVNAPVLVLVLRKWWRELRAMDAPAAGHPTCSS
ncbi:MAG TPA: CDP-alcohol phosphatidyltransferase family protein [Candidatus Eisenbacteria bacterium]|nr:CDP-alcohol phosphatidyltransferase family protein [Candidatus Eisenbacteria bacterium]